MNDDDALRHKALGCQACPSGGTEPSPSCWPCACPSWQRHSQNPLSRAIVEGLCDHWELDDQGVVRLYLRC